MQKTSVLLFGITLDSRKLRWKSIYETVQELRSHHSNLEINLLLFQFEPDSSHFKKETLELIDGYYFKPNANNFQKHMVKNIKELTKNEKLLIMSCCYSLTKYDFWDRPLQLCYDIKPFIKESDSHKMLNHKFTYGKSLLLKHIWSKREFDLTMSLDENMYLNAKNIIGFKKIVEHCKTKDALGLWRTSWGLE